MLSLVKGQFEAEAQRFDTGPRRTHRRVSRPEPRPKVVIPFATIQVTEAEPKGARVVRHVLRAAVVAGSLTAAWQIGMIVGQL